jgi:hypothetical protein
MAKTGQEAKTAHGTKTEKHYCECGGEISVKLLYKGGHLKPQAECGKCHRTARHVKQLFGVRY